MTVRIVLADDHPVVRRGLSAMLRSVAGLDVVGEAGDGRDAVKAAVTLQPDVLVLDIHMPVLDGVAAAREVRRAAPGVGILMLTMLEDDESVRDALAAGAGGYVLKGDSQDRIIRAIHAVAEGDTVLASGIARHVLGPAGRGRRVEDVAAKTVSNTLSTIFAKLGVTNRTEAALLARDAGRATRGPTS